MIKHVEKGYLLDEDASFRAMIVGGRVRRALKK